jgi:hypothetical protein
MQQNILFQPFIDPRVVHEVDKWKLHDSSGFFGQRRTIYYAQVIIETRAYRIELAW